MFEAQVDFRQVGVVTMPLIGINLTLYIISVSTP